MRATIMLVLVLVMVLGTGGVWAQDLGDVDPSGQTIVYWHQYSPDSGQGETIAALIEEFNATNEWGITVEGIHQGSYGPIRDLMNAAIISGEMPNLVAGFASDAMSWGLDGVVVDLNTYINDPTWGLTEEELADLNPGLLSLNQVDVEPFNGQLLAWPNQVSANVLAVNLTMLEALGFDGPPETFEEFRAVACAAAEMVGPNGEDIQGYPIKVDSSNFESYLASMGGEMWVDGRWNFTSEESLAVLQFYQDLYNDGCAYIPESQFGNTDDFALGLNPMALGSTAGIPFILSGFEASGVEAEWTVTTTPWTEGNRIINVFAPSIIMLTSTPEKQLASWLFIKFLASPDSQVEWTVGTSYFPVSLTAAGSLGDFEASNPQFAAANAIISDPDIRIYHSPNVLSYGAVRSVVSEMMSNVTANGMDVLEAAQLAEETANQIHADLTG